MFWGQLNMKKLELFHILFEEFNKIFLGIFITQVSISFAGFVFCSFLLNLFRKNEAFPEQNNYVDNLHL